MKLRAEITAFFICAMFFWFIECNHSSLRDDVAEETQHAVCNISTKDVQTSANASVTRQLRGVCTSKHLAVLFKELETMIKNELQELKKFLPQQQDTNPYVPKAPEYSFKAQTMQEGTDEDPSVEEILPIFSSYKTTKSNHNNLDDEPIFSPQTKTELLHPTSLDDLSGSALEERIMNLNDTVHKQGVTNIYYYFWKVQNFNKLMKKTDMYLSSPFFLVLGHELAIQLFPNQPKEDFLTIKLRTSRSFLKKHAFLILSRGKYGENLASPPLGVISKVTDTFSTQLKSIKNFECIKEDSIIIELNIHL